MQYLESDGSNFETYSVMDRKPVEISKNRRNMAKARFLGNDPSKCVLDKLQASQIRNRRTSQERVTVVESRTHYCGSYCLASLSGEGRTDVTECTNVKVRCLACFRNSLLFGQAVLIKSVQDWIVILFYISVEKNWIWIMRWVPGWSIIEKKKPHYGIVLVVWLVWWSC